MKETGFLHWLGAFCLACLLACALLYFAPSTKEDSLDNLINKNMIDAIIKTESAFNAKAVSHAGAKGLMQLMDPTGKEWHERLKIKEPYDPFDPKQNVKIGTAYIKHLYKQFGDIRLALAAYNWGPGNMGKTIARSKAENKTWSILRFSLPKETQKYVVNVLQAYNEAVVKV